LSFFLAYVFNTLIGSVVVKIMRSGFVYKKSVVKNLSLLCDPGLGVFVDYLPHRPLP
jgi:hypothetical protein